MIQSNALNSTFVQKCIYTLPYRISLAVRFTFEVDRHKKMYYSISKSFFSFFIEFVPQYIQKILTQCHTHIAAD